jgi:histone H3/H4
MNFVVLPTTMRRILKERSGLQRVEKAAALRACEAADRWLRGVIESVLMLATENNQKTIQAGMVAFVTEQEDTMARNWAFCKTRLRDSVKNQSPQFRWSLAAKILLYNAFDNYLQLLTGRIAATQELAKRKTISAKHVTAAIFAR